MLLIIDGHFWLSLIFGPDHYDHSCNSYGHLDAANELTRACFITQSLDSIDPVFKQITHTVQFNGGQYKEILK